MIAQNLLAECSRSGVIVTLSGNKLRLKGPPEAIKAAADRIRPHREDVIRHLLDQFQFELVEQDANPEELHRVNNMAWEFMQADGMTFSDAINKAAAIVATCDVAACEAAYTNVQELWRRITAGEKLQS